MATEFVTWDPTNKRNKRQVLPAPVEQRAGRSTISASATSVSVTFSSTMGNTNYAVTCTWQNTTDSIRQYQPIVITVQSATGFTASWNAPLDSANYAINWSAVAFT